MNWALKKRIIYTGLFLILLIIIFSKPTYNIFHKEPTCFDGKKNGLEEGLDCGGTCEKICEAVSIVPEVLWSRSFEIRKGVYNSIAMIENANITAGAKNVPYVFKLFDDRNVLVYERKGVTNIPAQSRFPIFEADINTGERIPKRTFFEFGENIKWFKSENIVSDLRIRNQKITNIDSTPKVEVEIENRGLNKMEQIELFAVVYNKENNAIGGSSTFIEELNPNLSINVTFTWPTPFIEEVGRVEVIPKF
jgi:hypothetical protein